MPGALSCAAVQRLAPLIASNPNVLTINRTCISIAVFQTAFCHQEARRDGLS
jgi:hypothetical protein